MSLKLLIADDEYFIRQRIKKIIPWEKLILLLPEKPKTDSRSSTIWKKNP